MESILTKLLPRGQIVQAGLDIQKFCGGKCSFKKFKPVFSDEKRSIVWSFEWNGTVYYFAWLETWHEKKPLTTLSSSNKDASFDVKMC